MTTRLSREVLFWRLVSIMLSSCSDYTSAEYPQTAISASFSPPLGAIQLPRQKAPRTVFSLAVELLGWKTAAIMGEEMFSQPRATRIRRGCCTSRWVRVVFMANLNLGRALVFFYLFFIPPSMNGRRKSISRPRLVSSPSWPRKQRKQQLRKHNECCCNHRWHMHSH